MGMHMNQGNWGALLQGGVSGAETEQEMQRRAYENQLARNATDVSNMQTGAQREEFNADAERHNIQAANANVDPNNPTQQSFQGYSQQTGQLFDPARNAIHSALAGIGRFYQNVFHGPAQGQTNPQAGPSGRGVGPAAQSTTQPPANAAMSRPQPTSSSGAGGTPGATGPMNTPDDEMHRANGGAIPGRKLAGIRAKKAKPGNQAKPTKGDKQVEEAQQSGGQPPQAAGGPPMSPPRNTEPGAGISNQDPVLAADGKWIQGAIKHPGALHKDLGVPQGENIPKSKIKAAEKKGGKVGERAQLAETMSKFKDGGMPSLPKLQPGAAPEPKPAPKAVEQDVNNTGMRHYLGKTIKRFDDGNLVRPDDPPNAQGSGKVAGGASGDIPTPAGPKSSGSEGLLQPAGRALAAAGRWIGNEASDYANEVGGALRHTLVGDPQYGGATGSWGNGASPPQHNADPLTPVQMSPHNLYGANNRVITPEEQANATPITEAQNNKLLNESKNDALNGAARSPDEILTGPPKSAAVAPRSDAGLQGPGRPELAQPPADAVVDFSKVTADQSKVPTMSTSDWQMMHDSIRHVAIAHGQSAGAADMMAGEEISKYQHGNFMQYMQQAAALDAAGNKQGAMTALKTAYQFFPTGHDMHFGLDANGDIVGYGVNEKTGQPVTQGAIRLNQQNLHGIMTHFANPENFVNEGIRMQQLGNETAKTKAEIPVYHERAEYLHGANPTRLAGYELRAEAANARNQRQIDPRSDKLYQAEFRDLPNSGQAADVAGSLEEQFIQEHHRPPDSAERTRIMGIVKEHFDPMSPAGSDAARQQWLDQIHYNPLSAPNQAQGSPVPNRYDRNPYITSSIVAGG